MKRDRITITIKNDVVKQVDRIIDGLTIRSRSQAIEYLLTKFLTDFKLKNVLVLAGGKEEVDKKPIALVDLNGKTGRRTPRIVMSDPYITTWLNQHPLKNDPEAPVWTAIGNRKAEKLDYRALSNIIRRIKDKTGIKKRVYAHLFRHSRVTHLLSNRQINESQAKVYFGWVPSSKVLSEYSHLVSNDVNDAILELNNIKPKNNRETLKPKICPSCRKINIKDALFCQNCSKPLDFNTAVTFDRKKRSYEDALKNVLKNDGKVREIIMKALMKEGVDFE